MLIVTHYILLLLWKKWCNKVGKGLENGEKLYWIMSFLVFFYWVVSNKPCCIWNLHGGEIFGYTECKAKRETIDEQYIKACKKGKWAYT